MVDRRNQMDSHQVNSSCFGWIHGIRWHWIVIHLACVAAFLVQIGSVLEGYMVPTLVNSQVEQKVLEDMEFPLIFMVCLKPGFNHTAIEEAGYDTKYGVLDYFKGKSKFNSSVYGWAGHTQDSGTQGSVGDILKRVLLRNKESALKKLQAYTRTKRGRYIIT